MMYRKFQKAKLIEKPKGRCWLARGAALFGVTAILFAVGSGIDNGSVFEMDGNASVQSTHDWNQIYADVLAGPTVNSTGALAQSFTTDPTGAGDDILTGGTTKDPQPFSKWAWKQTPQTSVQDKDDIQHAFAAAYKVNGHTVIFFGSDRFSNSGDSQMGFWFVQDPNVAVNGSSTGGGFNGQHIDGDLLIVSHFVNGGSVPQITLYQWKGPAETGTIQQLGSIDQNLCNPANGNVTDICAITNSTAFSPAWPFAEKASDNPPVTGLFLEGAIDLQTAIGGSPCFNVFFAETRSSAATTATLSDFTKPVPFSLCTVAVDKTCSTGSVKTKTDGSNFARYTFSGKVFSPDGVVYNPEITDTFPTGAFNTHIGQGTACTPDASGNNSTCTCTPDANNACTIQISASGGLSGGSVGGVTYTGYFDTNTPLPASSPQNQSGSNPNKVKAKAAATSDANATKTVISTLVSWSPNDGSGQACHISTTSALTLEKGCAVNIVPNSTISPTALNLEVQTEIKVCNTAVGGVQIKGINIFDNVLGLIAGNVTLNAPTGNATANCLHYYPKYTPTTCTPTTDGRCIFSDTVSILAGTTASATDCHTNPQASGCPVDDFGIHVTPIPIPAQATCRVCPPTGCSTTSDSAFPDPLGTIP